MEQQSPASSNRVGAEIRVGVAGWDYADWQGPVYPAAPSRSFDRLAWLTRFVDVIEVNSSFYRPVAPRTAASWVRRTAAAPRFRFTAKAHRSWTHDRDDDPEPAVCETLDGLKPLREAGRLEAVLVQFPQSFHDTQENRRWIDRLLSGCGGWPMTVEVRHASWADESAGDWFAERSLGWCAVDQPRAGRSTLETLPRVTSRLAYLRLHGRNRADWFRQDAGRDARYDYLYGREELESLCAVARGMAEKAEQLFVVQNNHFRGQALVNALQLRAMLEESPPEAPEELVLAYPQLEADVRVQRTRLF